MTLYSALYRKLTGDPTTFGIVGGAVWPDSAQDGVFPCLVIDIDRTEDASITPKVCQHYDVTMRCYAGVASVRDALAAAIVAAVDRQQWTDENVSVISSQLVQATTSGDAESGNPEAEYLETELTFHIIAGV